LVLDWSDWGGLIELVVSIEPVGEHGAGGVKFSTGWVLLYAVGQCANDLVRLGQMNMPTNEKTGLEYREATSSSE